MNFLSVKVTKRICIHIILTICHKNSVIVKLGHLGQKWYHKMAFYFFFYSIIVDNKKIFIKKKIPDYGTDTQT